MPTTSQNTGALMPSTFTGYLKMELQRRGVTVVTSPSGAYKFPQVVVDFEGFRPLAPNQRGNRMPVCLLWVFSGEVTAPNEYPFQREELEASVTFIWDKLQDMTNDPNCPVSMFSPIEPRGTLSAVTSDDNYGAGEYNAQTIEVGSGEFFAPQGYFYEDIPNDNGEIVTPPSSDNLLFDIDSYDYENDPLDLFNSDDYQPFIAPVNNKDGYDSRRFLPRASV